MRLTTDEVARRLGVRKATVYAYVSRGLLTSKRHGDGKESLFDEAEVTAFAAGRRRAGATGPEVHTGLTLITEESLYYRGRDVCSLAATASFESVVSLLWTGSDAAGRWDPDPAVLRTVRAVMGSLPPDVRAADRLRIAVAAGAAADRLRFDLTPAAVVATGRGLIGTMVAALDPPAPVKDSLAAALWPRLTDRDPTPDGVAALNTALVLLADHDLAASTFAARVAASTRADPWSVVSAGLAALAGPLHGAASGLAYQLLTSPDPMAAVAEQRRLHGGVPGFGHPLYPGGDPRARTLLAAIPGTDAMAAVVEAAAGRSGIAPNIDFALAALALSTGMGPDAGEAVFAIARTAGWIAHALEEYADQPSRFRPAGRYAGRAPAETVRPHD
ncbi:citrate synthase family protein [Symbioplanes lichenis]|uniref:citrate synthase family protein n=1 Tax=Symbioplanes lichenis TaxID=1629072 RepID=UPI0027381A35|nr:citrate synthase family protein [Actinoplanes lichenis]